MLKATEIADGILFPKAVQVLQLTRTVTDRKTGKRHTEIVYAITSLSVTDARPQQIADWLRGHWHIEDRLHWVRDVTYAEDHSQIRTQGGPQVMATLRNTAIGLLRLAGHNNIAAALRHHARDHHRPIAHRPAADQPKFRREMTLPRPCVRGRGVRRPSGDRLIGETEYAVIVAQIMPGHACLRRGVRARTVTGPQNRRGPHVFDIGQCLMISPTPAVIGDEQNRAADLHRRQIGGDADLASDDLWMHRIVVGI